MNADMRWKRSPPTTPGFYYWQGGHLTGSMVAVVQVHAFNDRTREMEARELLSDPWHPNAPQPGPVSSWGGIWAGPLPQPFFQPRPTLPVPTAAKITLPRCSVCKDNPAECSNNYSGGWVGTKCPN